MTDGEEKQRVQSSLGLWRDRVTTALAAFMALVGVLITVRRWFDLHQKEFLSMAWFSSLEVGLFYVMIFVLFVIRRPARESMGSFRHWAVALMGTWLPLALRMVDEPTPALFWISLPFMLTGMVIQLVALGHLGRSFGVVAANREIKTRGLYGAIRHPLYTGELLWFLSAVLQNLTLFNAVLFVAQLSAQIARMNDEESLLRRDPQYAGYMEQVRYRVFPGLY